MSTYDDDIPIMRVPISLPCTVPVLPGTPTAEAPAALRTERCAVDAWWVIGRAPICTLHLFQVIGEEKVRGLFPEFTPCPTELLTWGEMHRYGQSEAVMLNV